jgi:hypothetical protein
MRINDLWYSSSQDEWMHALDKYWSFVKPSNLNLEKELNKLNPDLVKQMNVNEFYDFLINKYFKWKYTAANRYATSTKSLKKYQTEGMGNLEEIKRDLFSFELNNISEGLKIATSINGLGPSGASGLLSLLFPKYFGTVDQFAVKALCEVNDLPQGKWIKMMDPDAVTLKNGVLLITVMRNKASELNLSFNSDYWTPRKMDMVLWTYGR